eukprot:7038243-Pyramimonas_sp.AAC.1
MELVIGPKESTGGLNSRVKRWLDKGLTVSSTRRPAGDGGAGGRDAREGAPPPHRRVRGVARGRRLNKTRGSWRRRRCARRSRSAEVKEP